MERRGDEGREERRGGEEREEGGEERRVGKVEGGWEESGSFSKNQLDAQPCVRRAALL